MQQGYFERDFVLTPDYCDARAGLSPLGAFTIFQAIATEHAEKIGVGGAAMAKRGEFWLTVHSRIDFLGSARLMQTLTAKTWPEGCDEKSIRCFRSYSLRCGDALVAMGRTQWAILGPEQKVVPFGQSGFPQDFPFTGEAGILDAPTRFRDDFTDANFDSGLFITLSDIKKEIIIKNSNISMDLNFSLSNFDSLITYNTKINCKADFSNICINGKFEFNHIHFKDNLNFLNAVFRDDFTFQNIIVEKDADFRNVVFFKKMKFENVEFKGNFKPAEIIDNDKIELKNVLINGKLIENNQKEKEDKKKLEKIKAAKEKIYKKTILKEKE